jgi:hypothetical protein
VSYCPFYGYNGMHGPLINTYGNQCALVVTSHAPCLMEQNGSTPDFDLCPLVAVVRRQAKLIRMVQSEPAKETP